MYIEIVLNRAWWTHIRIKVKIQRNEFINNNTGEEARFFLYFEILIDILKLLSTNE